MSVGPNTNLEAETAAQEGAEVATRYEPILLPHPGRTDPVPFEEYRAAGGYEGWKKALSMSPEEVVEEVKASGLRGRGGAGFPTGMKWGFVPKIPGPKYLTCNADESEPGTFKDREIMEIEPHMLLEGVAICSYAIGGNEAFIYIRGEYVTAADRLDAAIAEAERDGVLGRNALGRGFDLKIHVFRGAGAYICGEETALLESLEGRRPMPRSRPPFPAVQGLYDRPTVINNVETLANVPHILARGAAWYNTIGVPPKNTGPKIFCLSGCVNKPGNYELPLGSASLVVLDEGVCIVRAAARMEEFFRHESCGKCTPCREGTSWLHKILLRLESGRGSEADLDLLLSLSGEISGKVLCALGDFSTSPVVATIRNFRDEYVDHIRSGRSYEKGWIPA